MMMGKTTRRDRIKTAARLDSDHWWTVRISKLTHLGAVSLVAVAFGCGLLAGCNGSSNNLPLIVITPTPTATPTPSATPTVALTFSSGSSVVAVNCQTQKAWVALDDTGGANGDGKIAEVDLTVNPDTTNPVVATIDLGNNDIPVGAAVTSSGHVLVVAGTGTGLLGSVGRLYIFNQSDNSQIPGSPFPFPAGSDTGGISGVVFDPIHNSAVISMCDEAACDGTANAETGWSFFDLSANKFGPVLAAAEPDSVSLNPSTQLVIAPADAIDSPPEHPMDAGNATHSCTLSDQNLIKNDGDTEGSAADMTTSLFAIGDFLHPIVTVLNLNGATFSGSTLPCALNEAGTNPNSVNVDVFGGPKGSGDPADVVAINQVTHEILVASDLGPDVGLISLPSAPVPQLAGALGFQASALPDQPDGSAFAAFVQPFTAAVDACKNQGLIVDDSNAFLARVDLATLSATPAKISTALAAGKCTGGFKVSCGNGNGVTYFPLRGSTGAAGIATSGHFAHKRPH
jgi:hypothetical protein